MKRLALIRTQRGAATLVIVMVLFIVMALLAAYGNRSLLFEQRIASSYSRATLAQEMSEAGIDWAVAMLNGPAINEACEPATAPVGERFADRYLRVDASDRSTTALIYVDPDKLRDRFQADCTRSAEGWTCRCPKPDKKRPAPKPTEGEGLVPSFGLTLAVSTLERSGIVQVKGIGCTASAVDDCFIGPVDNSRTQKATALSAAQLALISAVRTPPSAPLVAKGDLESKGTGLGLHNSDPRTGGLLYVLGGKVTGALVESRLESTPGTQPETARIEKDATIKDLASDDLFRKFMGMKPSRYSDRPGLRVVKCAAGNCKEALEKAYASGWRMLWVEGPLDLGDGASIGTEADPVVVIATGDVNLQGPLQLTGMLVSLGDLHWTNATALPSLITGAVLVNGAVVTDGPVDVFYRQQVVDQLRNRLGSYVRVPGEWTDQTNS